MTDKMKYSALYNSYCILYLTEPPLMRYSFPKSNLGRAEIFLGGEKVRRNKLWEWMLEEERVVF